MVCSFIKLLKILSPDGRKTFDITECYVNGVYSDTNAGMEWSDSGSGIFSFYTKGKFVTAHWVDSQLLEIRHDKTIAFTQKRDSFFYYGDQGVIKYIAE